MKAQDVCLAEDRKWYIFILNFFCYILCLLFFSDYKVNLPDFRLELDFVSSWSIANLPLARMSWDKPSVFSAGDWVLYSELPPPKSGTNNLVYRLHLKQRTCMIHIYELDKSCRYTHYTYIVIFQNTVYLKLFLLVGLLLTVIHEQLKQNH